MMRVKAEFEGEACVAVLTPENEWEQKLLGAVAKGGASLRGTVTYKPEGHYTYGKAACVQMRLVATEPDKTEDDHAV